MQWFRDGSGTQVAVIGTEHVLFQTNANGAFQPFVDLSAMALGDVVELRVYTALSAASGLKQVWKSTHSGGPVNPVSVAPALGSDVSYQVTLKQVAGTGRSFEWKVLRA